jgi:phosphoketolase
MVANTWLEGTYSEIYPNVSQNKDGMRHLLKQFSRLIEHKQYITRYGDDMPEVKQWRWPEAGG